MVEDFTKRPLGVIPSPPDERDYPISRLIPKTSSIQEPDKFEYDYKNYIKDQKNISQCVSASGSCAREIIEKQQNNGVYKKLSLGFNYGYRKTNQYKGTGMIIREYLNNLLEFGIPNYEMFEQEAEWQEIERLVNSSNINKILKNAYQHRITAYAKINNSPEEIKLALRTLGPLIISIPIYSSFYKISASNPIVSKYDKNNEKFYGFHAMCLIGYDNNKKLYKVANSWSKNFGENGFCYFSYDWLFNEIWSITDNYIPGNYIISLTSDNTIAKIGNVINLKIQTKNNNVPLSNQKIGIKYVLDDITLTSPKTYLTDKNGIVNIPSMSQSVSTQTFISNWEAPDGNIYNSKPLTISWENWKVQIELDNKIKADILVKDMKNKGYNAKLI